MLNLSQVITDLRIKLAKMNLINIDKIIDEEESPSCPICSSKELIDYVCNNCQLDLKEIFICPVLSEEKICVITKKQCNLKALEFEQCDIYHQNDL